MKGKGRQGHAENFKGENNTLLLGAGGGLVYESCPTLATPWTVAHKAPLSMGFPRQEYWRGVPCPPPGDLPDPGIKFWLPALQADSLLSEPQGSPAGPEKQVTCSFTIHVGYVGLAPPAGWAGLPRDENRPCSIWVRSR